MKIKITAGDFGADYEAENGQAAIKLFFQEILSGRVKLDRLSPLGEWNDGTEPIPFRIAPALFKAGRLTAAELVATFRACDLDFEPIEIMSMAQADAWMIR